MAESVQSTLTLVDWLRQQLDDEERAAKLAAEVPARVATELAAADGSKIPADHTRWGWNGGPTGDFPDTPAGNVLREIVGDLPDRPYRVTVPAAWDFADADFDYAVAVVPSDHNAAEHIARWDPARVLAEVESKRRIIAVHSDDGDGDCRGCGFGSDDERMYSLEECPTLRLLALPYADNPTYRKEWRP